MAYITAAQLYADGLNEVLYPNDDGEVDDKIATVESIIESATKKWFESRAKTYELDGDDSEEIILPAAIISITSVSFANGFDSDGNLAWLPVPMSNFAVYNTIPNDWDEPKIAIRRYQRDYLDFGLDTSIFPEGTRNIKVIGNFGWTTQDGTVPLDIQEAAQLLCYDIMPPGGTGERQEELQNRGIKRHVTDKHETEFFQGGTLGRITGNAAVDRILAKYIGGSSSSVIPNPRRDRSHPISRQW